MNNIECFVKIGLEAISYGRFRLDDLQPPPPPISYPPFFNKEYMVWAWFFISTWIINFQRSLFHLLLFGPISRLKKNNNSGLKGFNSHCLLGQPLFQMCTPTNVKIMFSFTTGHNPYHLVNFAINSILKKNEIVSVLNL